MITGDIIILAETVIDNTKVVLVNVYAPNDPNQQVVFLRGLSNNLLSKYGNENLVLRGDFNCVIGTLDKRGGKPVDIRKESTIELKALIKTHNLLDTWRRTKTRTHLALRGRTPQ